MKKALIFLAALGLLAFVVARCIVVADETQFVVVTDFGRRVAIYNDAPGEAGLHVKWPWPVQSVQRFDHRLQAFDLPGAELLTHDPRGKTIDKTLVVDAYICWQIAGREGGHQGEESKAN